MAQLALSWLRSRSVARLGAALVVALLALTLLHHLIPAAAGEDDCSLCRIERTPSLPVAIAHLVLTPPQRFATPQPGDTLPRTTDSSPFKPLRAPPAAPLA